MSDISSSVRAEERQRIASALHNGLCQDLAILTLLTDEHFRRLALRQEPPPEAARIDHILQKTIDDLHGVMVMLRPPEE